MVRDLTLKDCEGLEVKSDNPMDFLAAVTEKALEEYEKDKKNHAQRVSNEQPESSKNARKRRKKESSSIRSGTFKVGKKHKKESSSIGSGTFEVGESSNREHAVAHVPQLPENFSRAIEEMAEGKQVSKLTLVMEKKLTKSDVDSGQHRLLIPLKKLIRDDFLKEDERRNISGKGKEKNYMDVRTIEPLSLDSVKFGNMNMNKRNGKTSLNYVMNGNWSTIVSRNRWKVKTIVQIWSFRIEQELCFALVGLPPKSEKS